MDTPEQTITITEAAPRDPGPPSIPRMAVRFAIGFVQLAREQVAATLRQAQAADRRADRPANRPRPIGFRLASLRRLPTVRGALRRAGLWRARANGSVVRLRLMAAEEQRAGRALALRALRGLVRTAAAELANSPEVKWVIREQSQGFAAGALSDMRQRSARADDTAEDLARRALHLPREHR